MEENGGFDALGFLKGYYSDLKDLKTKSLLENLHKLFSMFGKEKTGELRVLDFGSGPVIQNSISAAAFASEIVFCDISSANREAIQKWLDGDADAFDWSPHFDYVVKTLEGKDENEAREREQRMKQISRVAFCDALSESPMEKGFEGPYDVILQCACLEAACSDKNSYEEGMKTLTSLLKPGGVMVNHATNGLTDYERLQYRVGDKDHTCMRLTSEYVVSVFEKCQLKDIQTVILPLDPTSWITKAIISTANGRHFIYGMKE